MSREAIVNVVNLYSSVIDAHHWDLFDHVFTDDVEADYPGTLHWWDLASFKQDFSVYHETLHSHQHVVTNHQVLVDGDRGNSLTYGSYRLFEHNEESGGSPNMREGMCWYDDQLVYGPAGWRIRKRKVGLFWSRGKAPARAVIPGQESGQGLNDSQTMTFVDSLWTEAKAGRVAYYEALKRLS